MAKTCLEVTRGLCDICESLPPHHGSQRCVVDIVQITSLFFPEKKITLTRTTSKQFTINAGAAAAAAVGTAAAALETKVKYRRIHTNMLLCKAAARRRGDRKTQFCLHLPDHLH